MSKESLARWLKLLLCTLIVTLWISCLGLLCVSCWIRDNLSTIVVVTEGTTVGNFYLVEFFPVVFPVLISVSCLLLVIGCLGCCGAFTENRVILAWFFFSIMMTLCAEISAGVWSILDWQLRSDESDLTKLYENAQKYGNKDHTWFIKAWEEIHKKFKCCGISSYRDWDQNKELQKTCCVGNESCILSTVSNHGCGLPLLEFFIAPGPFHSMPYLTTLIVIIQVICLIITAKLWMLLCFLSKSGKIQHKQCGEAKIHDKKTADEYDVHKHSVGNGDLNQPEHIAVNNKNSYIPIKDITKETHTPQTNDSKLHCPQCAPLAFENIRSIPSSMFVEQYQNRFQESRQSRRARRSNRCSEEVLYRTNSANERVHFQSQGCSLNTNIRKTASARTPISWRSSSWKSMHNNQRECHSTGLPRKKMSPSLTWRQRPPRHYIQRLSTIRASGVAVESDNHTNSSSKNEQLGGSLCYNTEADSSASEDNLIMWKQKPYFCGSSPEYMLDKWKPNKTREVVLQKFEEDRSIMSTIFDKRKAGYPTL